MAAERRRGEDEGGDDGEREAAAALAPEGAGTGIAVGALPPECAGAERAARVLIAIHQLSSQGFLSPTDRQTAHPFLLRLPALVARCRSRDLLAEPKGCPGFEPPPIGGRASGSPVRGIQRPTLAACGLHSRSRSPERPAGCRGWPGGAAARRCRGRSSPRSTRGPSDASLAGCHAARRSYPRRTARRRRRRWWRRSSRPGSALRTTAQGRTSSRASPRPSWRLAARSSASSKSTKVPFRPSPERSGREPFASETSSATSSTVTASSS